MILTLVEDRGGVQREKLSIDTDANETVLGKLFEFLAISTFAAADDRREDHDAVIRLTKFAMKDGLDNLFGGLAGDGLAAIGTMRNADGGVDDAEVVVNLGDGANRGARGARGGFLLDGDGG